MRIERPADRPFEYPVTQRGRRVELIVAVLILTGFWIALLFAQVLYESPLLSGGRVAGLATLAAYTGPVWIAVIIGLYHRFLSQRGTS